MLLFGYLGAAVLHCSGQGADSAGADARRYCDAIIGFFRANSQHCDGRSASSAATLLEGFAQLCEPAVRGVASGALTFHPERARQCLDALAATPCSTAGAYAVECQLVIEGDQPAGADCYPHFMPLGTSECRAGRCLQSLPSARDDAGAYIVTCPGLCVPFRRVGQTCVYSLLDAQQSDDLAVRLGCEPLDETNCQLECEPGARCDLGSITCVAGEPPEPETCWQNFECHDERRCEGPNGPISLAPLGSLGTCQPSPATGPCGDGGDCSSTHCLGATLELSIGDLLPAGSVGECAPWKAVGDPCAPNREGCGLGASCGECGAGAYCSAAGICTDFPSEGEPCAGPGGELLRCDLGHGHCDPATTVCVPPLAVGEPCEPDGRRCESGNCEVTTVCTAVDAGAPQVGGEGLAGSIEVCAVSAACAPVSNGCSSEQPRCGHAEEPACPD